MVSNLFSKTVPFPRRLHGYYYDDWKEACEVKILETYDRTLPQKKRPPWSFTLPEAKEGMNLDSKSEVIGEAINESFDPNYGNYIKLNDLDVPLEPRMDQDNNFEPTLDESIIVNEPTFKSCYKMKFSCMIGYKHVNADLLLTLSINMMTKRFYNSIIKDKGDREGKKLAGTLIDMPIFVGNFSIILAPKTPYGVFLELPKLGTVTPEKIKQETPKSTITEKCQRNGCGFDESEDSQLGVMITDQSRLATRMVICMTQLMDTSGRTYQAFNSTLVGSSWFPYQRCTRRSTDDANTSTAQ
ncbi:hypothetical protein Tco_0156159 [Tanacetum coccineum]